MQKYVWPLIWGFVVALVIGFGLRSLETASGESLGMTSWWTPAFLGFITFFILANLAGNRKVANASAAERDQALSLTAPAGMGQVLIYREGFVGKAAGLNVTVDGQVRAQLKSPRFVVLPVAPGSHRLGAGFGGLAGAQNNAGDEVIEVAEGQTVVLRASLSMGMFKNTVKLERIDDADGVRRKLANVTMVKPEA
jgi:hypothetical protein